MTTTEPLQFSVMSAPLAALDRRALSQAWYSALYRQTAPARSAAAGAPVSPAGNHSRKQLAHTRECDPSRVPQHASRRDACADRSARPNAGMERRQIRGVLARKIERALLRPHGAPKSATFTVDGVPGRVHIIFRSGDRGLQLVAVCSPDARTRVAAALAQARYALASRGIAMDAQLRCEERAC